MNLLRSLWLLFVGVMHLEGMWIAAPMSVRLVAVAISVYCLATLVREYGDIFK